MTYKNKRYCLLDDVLLFLKRKESLYLSYCFLPLISTLETVTKTPN